MSHFYFCGIDSGSIFICPRFFLGQVITKNMSLCSWEITKKSFCQKRLYIFHFSTLWIWLFEIFDKCLQGQKLSRSSTGTTKSPIPGNHWVPLGCRALLGSVKPRQLMLSDRICCQTINVVRQWMLSDSQYHQTGNVVRQSIWSDNRAIPVMKL